MHTLFSSTKRAFTLVELITVVTILAILSTIGFVSFSGYLAGVRDTNRLSQLVALHDGLEIHAIKYDLPEPDSYTDSDGNTHEPLVITTDGSTVLGTQGYVGKDILDKISFTHGGVDPKDDSYFIYYLSANKRQFQLMAFLEETENIPTVFMPQTYAKDYQSLHPTVFGKKLGILLEENTNKPIQEVETGTLNLSTYNAELTAYFKNNESETDTGSNLVAKIEENRVVSNGNTSSVLVKKTVSDCVSSGTIIYGTQSGNDSGLTCGDDIILCSGNQVGYTLQACNIGATNVGDRGNKVAYASHSCPSGYSIPTETIWVSIGTTYTGSSIGNDLKIPINEGMFSSTTFTSLSKKIYYISTSDQTSISYYGTSHGSGTTPYYARCVKN